MISILRPLSPPAALISSAASCAACGIEEPATDCASAMTPILIGSLDCACADAASDSAIAVVAASTASCGAARLSSMVIRETFHCFGDLYGWLTAAAAAAGGRHGGQSIG